MTVIQRIRDHWRAAIWWRRESQISATPEIFIGYASNLEALVCHMIAHPRMYLDRGELTDWLIYQKEAK